MELFKVTISENSNLIYKSVQGTRLNAVNETIFHLRGNRIKPAPGSGYFVTIEQQYCNNVGKVKVKCGKNDRPVFRKTFMIHYNEFTYALLEEEMINRFVKTKNTLPYGN